VVDEEGHVLGRPLGGVGVKVAGVDGQALERELVADPRYWGTNSLALSWAWRTTRPSAKRDWPTGLPTGPANTPVWSDDTRVWPSNSGHQGGWSASMTSRRVPSPSRYLAAEASRELHWGR
jgi:hypothetical protein